MTNFNLQYSSTQESQSYFNYMIYWTGTASSKQYLWNPL